MSLSKNRQIAKNTGMLYIRMLLTLGVSLYISRIILDVLGVEDFGIYNVVGGFVIMFGFLNSAMSAATQRFLSFELGRKDHKKLKDVFSMSLNIHFVIIFSILFLAETIGLWFVNTQLTIPEDRMDAARWVYQFSILSLMVNMISVPYNALIIANERMNVFAWVSILEVGLKLLTVFMLNWFGFDKLKLYGVLIFGVALIIRIIYGIYCSRHFAESRFRFFWDKKLFNTLMNYAGWNLWGNAAAVFYVQGVNVLLNIFFGPVVNAARGIAYQVRGAVFSFVQNFQMAMNPQIIKSFAAADLQYMHQLIFMGAKFSFFLLFIITLPILFETKLILSLWLKTVPEYSVIFTQLVIVNILIDSISGPLMTAAHASGKIKVYQAVVGGLLLLILPISYVFLNQGFEPEVTLYVSIVISIIALIVRLLIISPLVNLSIIGFIVHVVVKIIPVALIGSIVPFIIYYSFPQGINRLFIIGIGSVLSTLITMYFIGLNDEEKKYMRKKIRLLIAKKES